MVLIPFLPRSESYVIIFYAKLCKRVRLSVTRNRDVRQDCFLGLYI